MVSNKIYIDNIVKKHSFTTSAPEQCNTYHNTSKINKIIKINQETNQET